MTTEPKPAPAIHDAEEYGPIKPSKHGLQTSGIPEFDRWREQYIDSYGFAPEAEADLSAAAERRAHFARVFAPELPEKARLELGGIFPDGVWKNPAKGAKIGRALRSAMGWSWRRRITIALTGRGKTLGLVLIGLRAMTDPKRPEAAIYLSAEQVQSAELRGVKRYKIPRDAWDAQLLLLDEMHRIPRLSRWHREDIFALVNHRYNHRLITVATAAAPEQVLRDSLGDEWVDRLATGDEIVKIADKTNWRRGE